MNTNDLPPHTDTIPHFHPFSNSIDEIHETKLPHSIVSLVTGVTLLKLGDKLEMEHLPTNGASGGGQIHTTPIFSDERIAYGQTRGFCRYNLKTHEYREHLVCTKLEEILGACRALEPEKNIFAFMIQNLEKGGGDRTRFFKVFDLSSERPVLLAKLEAGDYRSEDYGRDVVVKDSTLFFTHQTEKKLVSLNFKLEPVNHSFADAYNEHIEKLMEPYSILVHPNLPFAILQNTIDCVLFWKNGDTKLLPFMYKKTDHYCDNYCFSHDGKYLAWRLVSRNTPEGGPPVYYVAKIDEKTPGYIGMPIKLGSTFVDNNSLNSPLTVGWAEKPNTFIVSEFEGLYWWHVE